ncbi:MAG: ABC transporter ATP-binding protein [Anaerotignum sp.]
MKIEINNLTLKRNNRLLLSNINFSINTAKVVMLLGENGAGKTQLIKTILGFQSPTIGNVYYDAVNIKNLSLRDRAKSVAYVSQESENGVRFRVSEIISMGHTPNLNQFHKSTITMKLEAERIMKEFGVWDFRNSFIDEISGGECRLAYLCKALVQDTPWLILDEPTAFLDYKKQHHFLNILTSLAKEKGKGIFMSIHDPSMAAQYADVLILLKKGELVDIVDIHEDGYEKLSIALSNLYEHEIVFEDSTKQKMLVWR